MGIIRCTCRPERRRNEWKRECECVCECERKCRSEGEGEGEGECRREMMSVCVGSITER